MSEYSYPLFDENGKVVCQICGKAFLVISPRHLKYKHKIEYREYTMRFPDAPLSTEEFIATSKFGKVKSMMGDDKIDEEGLKEIFIDEPIDIDDDDDLEDFDLEKAYQKDIIKDPIKAMKNRIFDHLKVYLSNVKMDYMVQEFAPSGHLIFETITDFCDPVLKIVIDFPDTFWHNRGFIDPSRDLKLRQNGWKVLSIKSADPKLDKIDEALDSL